MKESSVYDDLIAIGCVNIPQTCNLDVKFNANHEAIAIHDVLIKHKYQMVTNHYFDGKPFPPYVCYRFPGYCGERVELHYKGTNKNKKVFFITFDRRHSHD